MVPTIQRRMREAFFLPYHKWMFSALAFKDQTTFLIFCDELISFPWRR